LLSRTPVKGPYVPVGHSIGGEYVRIFTARFPSEVAGLVLVDSTHPDQREPAMMLSPANRLPIPARRLLCFAMPVAERFGVIRFFMRNSPVDVPPEFCSEEAAASKAVRGRRVKGVEAEATQGCAATKEGVIRPERDSGNPEVDQAAANAGMLGDRPLIVLTAGKYWIPDDLRAAQQIAAFHQTWIHQLQSDLARLSSNGKQPIVLSSGHGIPQEDPEAVVKAVQDVVFQVRQVPN
jgi:pimeloyl-ACP methyl ester carboxylesterase